MSLPPPDPLDTALVTFTLTNVHGAGTVDVVGSWDNFRVPYSMTKDTQKGHGSWYACPFFDGIICDGEPASCTLPRKGALKMGGTYWFHYVKNGNTEFTDPQVLTTTDCPLRPGDAVNVITVPVGSADADQFTSQALLLNPIARTWADHLPPTPSDHPYRRAKRLLMPRPELLPLRWDLFNDTHARLQTAVAESIITTFHHPSPTAADARFTHDPLVRRIAIHVTSPSRPRSLAGSNPDPPRKQAQKPRMVSEDADRVPSPPGVVSPRPMPAEAFFNPFLDRTRHPSRRLGGGALKALVTSPAVPPTLRHGDRPHSWNGEVSTSGAEERDLERSLLRSRGERRTQSAMGKIASAPHLARKAGMSKRMSSLRKSLSIRHKPKKEAESLPALPPLQTHILRVPSRGDSKDPSTPRIAPLSPVPPSALTPPSRGSQTPLSRATSQRLGRMASIKERLRKPGKRNAQDLPSASGPSLADVDDRADDEQGSRLPTRAGAAPDAPSEPPRPPHVGSPVGPSRDVMPAIEESRGRKARDEEPREKGLTRRLSQSFLRSSRGRSKSRTREPMPPLPSEKPARAPTADLAAPEERGAKAPGSAVRRRLSQRFLRRDADDAEERKASIARTGPASPEPCPPAAKADEKPSLRRKISKLLGLRGGAKTAPTSPTFSTAPPLGGHFGGTRTGSNVEDPSASQETIRPRGADADAPPVPTIPVHFASPGSSASTSIGSHRKIADMGESDSSGDRVARPSDDAWHGVRASPSAYDGKRERGRGYGSGVTDEAIAGLTPPLLASSEFSTPSTNTIDASLKDVAFDDEARESFSELHRGIIRDLLKGTAADQGPRSSLDEHAAGFSEGFDYLGSHIG